MKKVLIVLLTTMLAVASVASSAEIGDLAWNEANIKRLRALDKAAVVRFVQRTDDSDFSASDYGEFDWYPAGDGKYELALSSSTAPTSLIWILLVGCAGKIQIAEVRHSSVCENRGVVRGCRILGSQWRR
jgi:hypothetical protein